MFFFFDYDHFEVKLDASPKEAGLAIVSTDYNGTPGYLNRSVLKEYNLDLDILKSLDLKKGFDFYNSNGKTILFIVTVGQNENTENLLRENLFNALTKNIDKFSNKTLWIPLMGTGSGGLNFSESYSIIKSVLDDLKENINKYNSKIILSIFGDKEGRALFKEIEKRIKLTTPPSKLNKSEFEKENEITIQSANQIDITSIVNNKNFKFYFIELSDNEIDVDISKFVNEYNLITNKFKIGDVLIDKIILYYGNKKVPKIKIKRIGIIKGHNQNKQYFKVDWIIAQDDLTIESLYGYDFQLEEPTKIDIGQILDKLTNENLSKLVYELNSTLKIGLKIENLPEFRSSKTQKLNAIAGLLCDSDKDEDHLDIKKDVEAFARVMAAKSFHPPLAIALLGKWGSGKSFFMRKLKEDIQILSKSNPQDSFCEGIAHVHFNAWSYMDANLWASIVSRIFEGLDEYINGLNLSDKEKKDIEEQLFQKLTISREEHSELENQKNQIKKRIHELKTNKKNIKRELKNRITSIRNNSLKEILGKVDTEFKVQEQIQTTLKNNQTFVDSVEKLEKIVPRQYWENPTVFYKELNSIYTFLKSFLYRKKVTTNLIWVGCFLSLILIVPVLTYLTNILLSWQDFRLSDKAWFSITIIGSFLTRGIDTYIKLKKQIAPFWSLKEKYEEEKKEAISKCKREEKALKIEISQKKEEVIQINNEISSNLQLQANLEFKLKNALSTQALYTFIEKRANSEDYKKHLGIVSLIRKDFEILSGLLTEHQTELVSNIESKQFKEMFHNKKPLERIILYIDDLDRCPEERVVEVLEAVNLLMAFPLFIVVVGVDPRWVKNALIKKHHLQFTGYVNNTSIEEIEVIEASSYLEKIFQVPFHLKDAENISIKNMIEKLAKSKPNLSIENNNTITENQVNKSLANNQAKLEEDKNIITVVNGIPHNNPNNKLPENKGVPGNVLQIEALEISDKEIENIKKLAPIIGNSPRSVKRFINIYRIIKTHEEFTNNYTDNEDELLTVMFLLALSIGKYSSLINPFETFLLNNKNRLDSLVSFFQDDYKLLNVKTRDLNNVYSILFNNIPNLLKQTILQTEKHYDFIKRFTFKNI